MEKGAIMKWADEEKQKQIKQTKSKRNRAEQRRKATIKVKGREHHSVDLLGRSGDWTGLP